MDAHFTPTGVSGKCVNSFAFNPRGTELAVGNNDGTLQVWDTHSWKQLLLLRGHTGWIGAVAYSPDGTAIASGGGNYLSQNRTEVKIWNARSSPETLALQDSCNYEQAFSFSPNGRLLASTSGAAHVSVCNVQTSEKLFELLSDGTSVRSVMFSPDGKGIAAGTGENLRPFGECALRIWFSDSGSLYTVLQGHTEHVSSIAFSPDSKRVASASWDGSIKVWQISDRRLLLELRPRQGQQWFEQRVHSIAFSPGGNEIAAALWTGIDILNATDGSVARNLSLQKLSVNSVAWHPDGKRLVSAGGRGDSTVKLWEVQSGRLLMTLAAHTDAVSSTCFSPDGRRLATCGYDGRVLLWDTLTGLELLNLGDSSSAYESVAFSPNGRTLAVGERSGKVLLWETSSVEANLDKRRVSLLKQLNEDASNAAAKNSN